MRRPAPTWETDYRHDRRKHRHRCRCCKRVIVSGERVIMARVEAGGRFTSKTKTVAMHAACAERRWVPESSETGRDIMVQWGLAGLKKAGWHVPELETHYS